MWLEYLSRFPSLGVDTDILLPMKIGNKERLSFIDIERSYKLLADPFYWPKRIFERPEIRSFVLDRYIQKKHDIFQSTYFTTVNKKVPKVAVIYDMIYEIYGNRNDKWINFIIGMKEQVVNQATRVIAISENTKTDLLNYYPKVKEENVEVITLAANYKNKMIQRFLDFEEIQNRFHISIQQGEYLLFVGKRNGYKNFSLVESLLSHKNVMNMTALCVGGEKRAKESFNELPNNNKVIYVGQISEIDLVNLYQNALALIYPSKYEGFGLPILEAMENRCPVICSNTSSLPEVGGDAAIYFDPQSLDSLREAFEKLLVPSFRNRLIEKGLENAKRFSWDDSARKLVDVYKTLCE